MASEAPVRAYMMSSIEVGLTCLISVQGQWTVVRSEGICIVGQRTAAVLQGKATNRASSGDERFGERFIIRRFVLQNLQILNRFDCYLWVTLKKN